MTTISLRHHSLAALIRWNEAAPGGDPAWPVAVARGRSHHRPRRPQYRADRARDIVLSRTAGIDAAIVASGGRCVDRADDGRSQSARARQVRQCSPFRWGSMAPQRHSASRSTRRRDGTASARCRSSDCRNHRRAPRSETLRLGVTPLIARGHAPRFPMRLQSICHRGRGRSPGHPRDSRCDADGRSARDAR